MKYLELSTVLKSGVKGEEVAFETTIQDFDIIIDLELSNHPNIETQCAVYIVKNNLDNWSLLKFGENAVLDCVKYINNVIEKYTTV